MMEKKLYVSPAIESERVDLPQAWACNVFGTTDDPGGGRWSGPQLGTEVHYICP
jgi:hypothetical protein